MKILLWNFGPCLEKMLITGFFPSPTLALASEDIQQYKRLSGFSSGDYVIQLKSRGVFFFFQFLTNTHYSQDQENLN